MVVKILGSGCAKCNKLEEKVKDVASKNGIAADFQKVTDMKDIMQYKIMMTPALVIDEKVKSYGIIPGDDQILQWLKGE